MRYRLLIFTAMFTLAASADMCQPGTLQDYIDLPTAECTAGSVTFSNFAVVQGQAGATQIDPALVSVMPTAGSGLLFTLNQTATAGQLFESFFQFGAAGSIQSTLLSLLGSSATGDGVAAAGVDLCADGFFVGPVPIGCDGTPETLIALVIEGDGILTSPGFTGGSFFDIFVDLTVDGGLDGQAIFGAAQLDFNAVPEPATYALMAPALAFLIWNSRRRS